MSKQNEVYLRRKAQLILPQADNNTPVTLPILATAQKNLQSLGYIFSKNLFEQLGYLSEKQLVPFVKELIQDIKVNIGANHDYKPFYPNFPQQVIKTSDLQLYLNALSHYWTLERPQNIDYSTRSELTELIFLKQINKGNHEDWWDVCRHIIASKTPYNATDQADVAWIICQYRDKLDQLLPEHQECKENLCFLGACLLRYVPDQIAWFAAQINTATDVLRLLIGLSDGDISLTQPSRIKNIPRSWRKLMLSWMNEQTHCAEDMLRYQEQWKRVGEILHPAEYTQRYPYVAKAFTSIRDHLPIPRFNRTVEIALAKRDFSALMPLLSSRPGELARRLDHLLSLSIDANELCLCFEETVNDVSTAVLLQVINHFEQRAILPIQTKKRPLRVFFPKGNVAKLYAMRNLRPVLSPEICQQIILICQHALINRFSQRPSLGKCYLDPQLNHFFVPFSHRSTSKALRTLTRGSRIALPDHIKTLRFFIWWKNGKQRTDIDLSAVFYDKNFNYVDEISYYNLRSAGAHHSGDIVDAPQGACEFIDIALDKMYTRHIHYVVMSINSYTQEAYVDLPECFAGWMAREYPNSGEIFEPATVQDKIDLSADTTIALPIIFDLYERRAIWVDVAYRCNPVLNNNVAHNLSGISLMVRAMVGLKKTTLYQLFALHIQARGELVSDPNQANNVFSTNGHITPFDLEKINSEYL